MRAFVLFLLPVILGTILAEASSPITMPIYPNGTTIGASGSSTLSAANLVAYSEFVVEGPGVVLTGNASLHSYSDRGDAGHWSLAIMDSTCTLVPGSQFSTATGTGTTQAHIITLSDKLTLLPGKYFIAFSSDSTLTQFVSIEDPIQAIAALANQNESATTNHYFIGSNPSTTVSNVTTMPRTCGTRTSISPALPFIVLH